MSELGYELGARLKADTTAPLSQSEGQKFNYCAPIYTQRVYSLIRSDERLKLETSA